MTRRELAVALLAPVPAAAQATSPAAPEDLNQQAREVVRRNREALSRFKLDRSVEPAARFEA